MQNKRDMLRIVRTSEGEISLDTTGKKSGRGAYICSKKECFEKLKKQKLLHKTFNCQVADEVYEKIEEEFFGKEK